MFELFGLWILCGLTAALIIGKRGEAGSPDFFLGFFLGPIGLVMALSTHAKSCPFCGGGIHEDGIVCQLFQYP